MSIQGFILLVILSYSDDNLNHMLVNENLKIKISLVIVFNSKFNNIDTILLKIHKYCSTYYGNNTVCLVPLHLFKININIYNNMFVLLKCIN